MSTDVKKKKKAFDKNLTSIPDEHSQQTRKTKERPQNGDGHLPKATADGALTPRFPSETGNEARTFTLARPVHRRGRSLG